jgi:hypothetical protein
LDQFTDRETVAGSRGRINLQTELHVSRQMQRAEGGISGGSVYRQNSQG